MLILARKLGECVLMKCPGGGEITVRITSIEAETVTLGIDCPPNIGVLLPRKRGEQSRS